jgi:hypothetical protein
MTTGTIPGLGWACQVIVLAGFNPKGNAETRRFMRTLKEERLWLEEFAGLD